MVKSRISILVSLSVEFIAASNSQGMAEDGKDAIRSNDCSDSRHDGPGRCFTDRRGAVARLHAAQASGIGNQKSEERPFHDPKQVTLKLDRMDSADQIFRWR